MFLGILDDSLLGILGRAFQGFVLRWVGVGVKLPLCLKLVRIMLETSNLVRKYTSICSFRKYTFQCLGPLNFADVSIFLQKNQRFLSKKVPLLKAIVRELYQRFFSSAFSFCKTKVTVIANITSADSVSGIGPPDCSKLVKNPKNDNDVTIFRHDVIVNFF